MKVAVVGGGVVGLAATYFLRRLGADVTCFESTALMSQRSAGESRIFRLAHTEPAMVAAAREALEAYRGWETHAGEPLITHTGTVISGDPEPWIAAMAAAGAEYTLATADSGTLRLPTSTPPGSALLDPSGGVIRVNRVRQFLAREVSSAVVNISATVIEETPGGVTVHTPEGTHQADAVIIAAGADTPALAAQVGLRAPTALAHHARFTFALCAAGDFQCWIAQSSTGLSTYQHMNAAGQWAVGAHFEAFDVAWAAGCAQAAEVSRKAVTQYVATELDMVEPGVIKEMYCSIDPSLGDGFWFPRSARVLAIYGENLFKFAPLLGQRLAQAALDGSALTSLGTAHSAA